MAAVAAQLDRGYMREKPLEGQKGAAGKGNHGGRPKVIDGLLIVARALKDNATPVPEITKKLVIRTGKNAGQRPSVASLSRALAEPGETAVPGTGGSHYRARS